MKKRILIIVSAVLAAVMLFGCTAPAAEPEQSDNTTPAAAGEVTAAPATSEAPQTTEEKTYKETIKFSPSLKFVTTDTMNTTSGTSLSLYYLVYNNLVEMDTVNNQLVPGLAESWEEVSPTEYVFHLRQGVKFHDGSDFTAADVEFTFNRAKEQGASAGKVTTIDHVEVIDDFTIKFYLTGPDADILYRLPDGRLSILSKTAFDTMAPEEANKIGTGPYMYVEVVIDDHVTLTRNDNYWGELPKTKNFILQEIPEASARLIALQTGEVDIIQSPAATDLHYIDEDANLTLSSYPGANLRYIGLNMNEAPFDDIRVRQAIAYGINRAEYIAVAYNGNAAEVNNMMNPINEFWAEITGYTYDPEKAKALLTEAGYSDGDITISITGMQNDADTSFATLFQSQMKAIGINVNVDLVETATFTARVKPDSGENWQVEVNGWGGYVNGPDNALRYLYYSSSSGNAAHVNDTELDALIDEASVTTEKASRVELYKQIEQKGIDLACYIPICVPMNYYGTVATLEGLEPLMGSIHHLRNIAVPEN